MLLDQGHTINWKANIQTQDCLQSLTELNHTITKTLQLLCQPEYTQTPNSAFFTGRAVALFLYL